MHRLIWLASSVPGVCRRFADNLCPGMSSSTTFPPAVESSETWILGLVGISLGMLGGVVYWARYGILDFLRDRIARLDGVLGAARDLEADDTGRGSDGGARGGDGGWVNGGGDGSDDEWGNQPDIPGLRVCWFPEDENPVVEDLNPRVAALEERHHTRSVALSGIPLPVVGHGPEKVLPRV
ncbi:unnamed protein product [Allacma fusca]|uniref:Uncharacterized protein n=1 Tax=Allacma fusca TaxID=39272 RepID=A0A8J2PKP8_9HEXA|nr:unnamed protein product [Allacma fusca]